MPEEGRLREGAIGVDADEVFMPERWASCYECKYKSDYFWKCKAYPEGIPDKISMGVVSHTKPYKGDNGIQFEQKEQAEAVSE